ncbi:5-(carboxyamino)imidazole ribonucleotide synthase [Legionella spiritensis]|uniref:N5-carboxyaminoimidazole ribonucleotide synthase n=1 Tax=Legionella spiritensis TaxID=452 RepID=A0A0W0Z8U6_LEGSP|nr:5-(carboxyamino)imidazole ribonucleotide synthase [Legionella spiritensis]KTD65544.1 phosphoribosylaminoimidazole carboxylase ATPase subunit [Legionella spiritensis]SNV44557.1 phosphoribosylaminoimidazole carboxylase ATPase subunit [Legionella spiritensis]
MKIGVLGGGQLSRMLALAGIPAGLEFCFYEPKKPCCSESLGRVIYAPYDDRQALLDFAGQVDLITYENENIPIETIDFLQQLKPVYPDKTALQISQDRLFEKNLFQELNIPTARYYEVNNQDDLKAAVETLGFPVILKKRHGGYDGKCQLRLYKHADLNDVSDEQCTCSIVESFVNFDREVSMIAARNKTGDCIFYDLSENIHLNGILFSTANKRNDPFFATAQNHMDKLLKHLDYVGVLALEFFQEDQQLIANEMAPRVHNSGHWTIEAAMTSQFANHVRCILGWPPARTDSLAYATMYNVIGHFPDKNQLANYTDLHWHDYQKEPRAGRKLGHVTILSQRSHVYHSFLETSLKEPYDDKALK